MPATIHNILKNIIKKETATLNHSLQHSQRSETKFLQNSINLVQKMTREWAVHVTQSKPSPYSRIIIIPLHPNHSFQFCSEPIRIPWPSVLGMAPERPVRSKARRIDLFWPKQTRSILASFCRWHIQPPRNTKSHGIRAIWGKPPTPSRQWGWLLSLQTHLSPTLHMNF